jgi:uncharacterized protein (DUF1330 family)
MPGYIVAQIEEVTDPAALDRYREQVGPLVAQYGGRYLAAGPAEGKEGSWRGGVFVVIEFPTKDRAQEWYDCAEYQPLKQLRKSSTRSNMVLVDGL